MFVVSNLVVFEILCRARDVYWKLSLQLFQAGLVELCLAGIELATYTSITGDVTTNPTTYLNKQIEKDILFGYFSNNK